MKSATEVPDKHKQGALFFVEVPFINGGEVAVGKISAVGGQMSFRYIECAVGMAERKEVDAVVLVGSEGVSKLTLQAQAHLSQVPTIVLDYPSEDSTAAADVRFTTAIYGIHRHGTAYRMDEVPIPLRQLIDSPLPADHEVLDAIMNSVASRKS